jgi:choline dehydrogenase
LDVVVAGAELVRRFAATETLSSLIEGEALPGPDVATPAQLAAYVRENVRGYFHGVGTCRMGHEDDPGAVVDGAGRVHGVEGLYVCDASIMPTIPRANTNVTTIAIAERIAEQVAS